MTYPSRGGSLVGRLLEERERSVVERDLRVESEAELETGLDVWRKVFRKLSRDLRRPLEDLLCHGELLKNGVAGPLTAPQTDWLDEVLANARRALAELDGALDLTREERRRP